MKEKQWYYCIYRITNLINNKTYIGKHKYCNLREPLHNYTGGGVNLRKAYKKYGIQNFKKEVLVEKVETLEEINKLEIQYIKEERERKGISNVYNIAHGGEGNSIGHPSWIKGKHWDEDHKKRVSEKLKGSNSPLYGIPKSEETKRKMSENHADFSGEKHPMYGKGYKLKGEKNGMFGVHRKGPEAPMYGKHHSEETKKKLKEIRNKNNTSELIRQKSKMFKEAKANGTFTGTWNEFQKEIRLTTQE